MYHIYMRFYVISSTEFNNEKKLLSVIQLHFPLSQSGSTHK